MFSGFLSPTAFAFSRVHGLHRRAEYQTASMPPSFLASVDGVARRLGSAVEGSLALSGPTLASTFATLGEETGSTDRVGSSSQFWR